MKELYFYIDDRTEKAKVIVNSKIEKLVAQSVKLSKKHNEVIRELYEELEKLNGEDIRMLNEYCDEFSIYTGENIA